MKSAVSLSAVVIGLVTGGAWAAPITIDFDRDAGGNALAAGTVIQEQYAGWGVHITANNATSSHPDMAIIFDSANPTGGDSDLKTPGYHPSNTTAMGNILILAENAVDANQNGLIDSPDDEANHPAGWIKFAFDSIFNQAAFTLIDTEETGGTIDFILGNVNIGSIGIPGVPDNAVSNVSFAGGSFDQIRVNLAGSGGIASVSVIPEPASLALLGVGSLGLLRRRRR